MHPRARRCHGDARPPRPLPPPRRQRQATKARRDGDRGEAERQVRGPDAVMLAAREPRAGWERRGAPRGGGSRATESGDTTKLEHGEQALAKEFVSVPCDDHEDRRSRNRPARASAVRRLHPDPRPAVSPAQPPPADRRPDVVRGRLEASGPDLTRRISVLRASPRFSVCLRTGELGFRVDMSARSVLTSSMTTRRASSTFNDS